MGTSKNYPSPNSTRWNAVRRCYENPKIPEQRVAAEVWRAATQENTQLQDTIASEIVFSCSQIVQQSSSPQEAIAKYNAELMGKQQNSLVTEFAKRAIVTSFASEDPGASWRQQFLSELTGYFVSRDLPGYIGEQYRIKNVEQMNAFKQTIKKVVADKVQAVTPIPSTTAEWKTYVTSSLNSIKNKGE